MINEKLKKFTLHALTSFIQYIHVYVFQYMYNTILYKQVTTHQTELIPAAARYNIHTVLHRSNTEGLESIPVHPSVYFCRFW